ncbi:MAG TPA: choice-of-anchor Q domain-containing protein [Coleofasciculaceae cyanobacterium]|jgi:hypothetical protein
MAKLIVVKTAADSGAGSLRAAIASAQSGDTIRFAAKLTHKNIRLTSGQLELTKNLTIDAAKAPGLTISGNGNSRVFKTGEQTQVTLKNLTIANGKVTGDEDTGAGGGILTGNRSQLTVVNCKIHKNSAAAGGGIYSGFRSVTTVINSSFDQNDGSLAGLERGGGAIAGRSASVFTVKGSSFTRNRGSVGGAINTVLSQLLVENSVFRDNEAVPAGGQVYLCGYGGAIYTDGANASGPGSTPGAIGGTIIIRNSRIEGNRGAGQGGGMFLFAYPPDQVTVENSWIANNRVVKNADGDALGGGLRHGNAELTLRNMTFTNNRTEDQGGGLWIGEKSPVNISNSTFSGNIADDGQGNGLGGAITFANGKDYSTTIAHTTIAYNRAGFMGGAVWSGDQPITLTSSIVAFNTGGNPWKTNQQIGRTFKEGGHNIEFPAPKDSQDTRVTANSRIVDPKLATLKDNGGFAPTHALLSGSPALNTGSLAPSDQRGIARDAKPDIGAVETAKLLVFSGSTANDYLAGSSRKDRLLGNAGDDVLVGRGGSDRLTGSSGADWFGYSGKTQKAAFAQSRLQAPDQITDWNSKQGDRIFLDTNQDGASDRPLGLFNAGNVNGGNLSSAAQAAYADKNYRLRGKQVLKANEAVLFNWQKQTYLGVNDRAAPFSASRDLLIELTGAAVKGAGVLAIDTYFV